MSYKILLIVLKKENKKTITIKEIKRMNQNRFYNNLMDFKCY